MRHIIFLICLTTLMPQISWCEILKYTDMHGKLHFVDKADKVPTQYQAQIKESKPLAKINKLSTTTLAQQFLGGVDKKTTSNAATTRKHVEVFVTSWCPFCKKLEAYLKDKNIKYTRYDIEKNRAGFKKYQALGSGGIPITKIGKTVINGFQPDGIMQALR